VPSVRAEPSLKAGRPQLWVTGLVLCLLAGVLAYLTLTRPEVARVPAVGHRAGEDVDTREAAATALLSRLSAELEQGSRVSIRGLAAPGDPSAARELADLVANVRRLRITDLALRYVDEDAGRLSAAEQQHAGGNAWVGDVQLNWRIRGFDQAASHLETTMTFATTPHGARFVSARGDYGDSTPLWLLDRVHVRRTARSLVMATRRQDADRFLHLADQAVVDVHKVLPRWQGKLVVEVPASQQQLNRTLGSGSHAYDKIAAVTTTADGTLTPSAPTHIFINPPVFDPLGNRGSQIVLSHEATHVATHAATASLPTWLLEGFADYVALDHVHLPVTVTASQILQQVRDHGAPSHLPGKAEFDSASSTLGASYEAAWLACRLIGENYGEAKMLEFYRRSDRDSSTARAFRDVLGTNETAFTRAWQAYLRSLAR
jgi:uncharacterized protein YukE